MPAGLVDLQLNGAFGAACEDGPEAIRLIAAGLPAAGVQAFCPTLVSSPRGAAERLLGSLPRDAEGAEVLGAHLEGPFLNPRFAGAHDPACLRAVDLGEVEAWLDAGPPAIVTLAPELPGACAAIERLAAAGVLVALGHSAAGWDEAARAVDAGARLVTHLFNAMPGLHHRSPGLVGFALERDDVLVSVIGDGAHLDPAVLRLVYRLKGPERVLLVSDAVAAAGMPAGRYRLGGRPIESDGRVVRDEHGGLAGSAVLLGAAVESATAAGVDPAAVRHSAGPGPRAALARAVQGRL